MAARVSCVARSTERQNAVVAARGVFAAIATAQINQKREDYHEQFH